MEERLRKQLDFALEIDKEKNIFRQTHLSGHGRNENDGDRLLTSGLEVSLQLLFQHFHQLLVQQVALGNCQHALF